MNQVTIQRIDSTQYELRIIHNTQFIILSQYESAEAVFARSIRKKKGSSYVSILRIISWAKYVAVSNFTTYLWE